MFFKYVHNEKSMLLSTKYKLPYNCFNLITRNGKITIDRFQPFTKIAPAYLLKNKNIREKLNSLEELVETVKNEGFEPTIEIVRERLRTEKMKKIPIDFLEFLMKIYNQMIDDKKIRRAKKYKTISTKISTLLKKDRLPINDITSSLLREYREKAKSRLSNTDTTIDSDLKAIRAALNLAHAEGLLAAKPSFKGIIKNEESPSRQGLSLDQFQNFVKYPVIPGTNEFHAKNAWLFSLYLAGIRIGDLLQLNYSNIEGDHLIYRMTKTKHIKRPVMSLKILPPAQNIIETYSKLLNNDYGFIIPILEKNTQDLIIRFPIEQRDKATRYEIEKINSDIESKTAILNKALKRISKALNFTNVNLTMHLSRHTLTQIGEEIGILKPEESSMLLNHANEKTTKIYKGLKPVNLDHLLERIGQAFSKQENPNHI